MRLLTKDGENAWGGETRPSRYEFRTAGVSISFRIVGAEPAPGRDDPYTRRLVPVKSGRLGSLPFAGCLPAIATVSLRTFMNNSGRRNRGMLDYRLDGAQGPRWKRRIG